MNDEQTGYWLTHKHACEFYGVSKNNQFRFSTFIFIKKKNL
jgi:hypothetical protein